MKKSNNSFKDPEKHKATVAKCIDQELEVVLASKFRYKNIKYVQLLYT